MHAVSRNMSRQAAVNWTPGALEWHMWRRLPPRRPMPHTSFSRRRWSAGIPRRPSDASRRDSIDQVLRRCRPAGHRIQSAAAAVELSSPHFCRGFRLLLRIEQLFFKQSTVWKSSIHVAPRPPGVRKPRVDMRSISNVEMRTTRRFTSIGRCRWKPSSVKVILRSRWPTSYKPLGRYK